ncbi:hypothetical protein BBP40_003523 [Aspergillus hancockii]|nr:hypothetical protein BBP40_003523 [Aspergillus hancockii]
MSVISKVQGALASLSNENILALMNLNLDLSLFKVEAPPEFMPLGNALSSRRREDAEDGLYHRIARRLAALFEQVIPSTPELLRAYGKRVSEISETPGINPKGSKDDGLFENMVGADGTSIWAAATSGSNAIAMHLLACMLARMWRSDEATSIWVELVEKRKQIIREGCEAIEPRNWASLLASQQEISRTELAHWDASARAWLNRADEARTRQQTQLMLIVKNVNIDVSSVRNTYENVMDAWTLALTTVNNLIKGMPQRGHDGAVLLGLASWHIYPALNVLTLGRDLIDLHDKLVPPGGILTLGLNAANPGPGDGVRWSLPLAHLRFYGEPVEVTSTISKNGERLRMHDFLQVVLGSALAGWGFSNPHKAHPIVQILAEMWGFVNRGSKLIEKDIMSCSETIALLVEEQRQEYDGDIMEAQEKARHDPKRRRICLYGQQGKTTPKIDPLSDTGSTPGTDPTLRIDPRPEVDPGPRADPLPETHHSDKYQMLQEKINDLRQQINHDQEALQRLADVLDERNPTWPLLLAKAAYEFCSADGVEKEQYEILQALGTRQPGFLGTPPEDMRPVFGLTDFRVISLISNSQEEQIDLLRDISKSLGLSNKLIIKFALADEFTGYLRTDSRISGLATTTPSKKRDREGNILGEFCRWIAVEETIEAEGRRKLEDAWMARRLQLEIAETFSPTSQIISPSRTNYGHGFTWLNTKPSFGTRASERFSSMPSCDDDDDDDDDDDLGTLFHPLIGDPEYAALYFAGDYPRQAGKDLESARALGVALAFKTDRASVARLLALLDHVTLSYDHPHSQAIKGICAAARVYQNIPTAKLSLRSISLPLHKATWIPHARVPSDLEESKSDDGLSYEYDLDGPSEQDNLYDSALLSLPLFEQPLSHNGGYLLNLRLLDFSRGQLRQRLTFPKDGEGFWEQWRAPKMDRSQAFACIVYFESGSHNHDPEGYKSVMAVSCGDSIYAAASLFSDPYITTESFEVKRIIGNIGHPGIVLLVPPACPMVRGLNLCDPFSVRHAAFDGHVVDKFPMTQLELSFTGYSESLRSEDRGACDSTVYVLEAQVRVYDSGSWVGDLDVLSALDSPNLKRPRCHCKENSASHDDSLQKTRSPDSEEDEAKAQTWDDDMSVEFASIDRWEELLQPPPERVGVIRAHRNWLARLAAASLSVQKGYNTLVLPRNICWSCMGNTASLGQSFLIA